MPHLKVLDIHILHDILHVALSGILYSAFQVYICQQTERKLLHNTTSYAAGKCMAICPLTLMFMLA